MERVQRFIEEAKETFKSADHLACMTYPMIREPKLIYSIAEKLYLANSRIMDAILYHEYAQRTISVVPVEFETRFNLFRDELVKKRGISNEVIQMILDLHELVQANRNCPVAFAKDESYNFYCNNTTKKTITIELAKRYLSLTRQLIKQTEGLNNDI